MSFFFPPTSSPTTTFTYPNYGPSSFGSRDFSTFTNAAYLDSRRHGWSWTQDFLDNGPFCHGSTCVNIKDICCQFGGIPINEYQCSFPNDVHVVGVSCWDGNCVGGGSSTCASLGGTTVSAGNNAEWCIYKDSSTVTTVVGPACWSGTCYTSELQSFCSGKGGQVWNDFFCILPSEYTVVGPVCFGPLCQTGSVDSVCPNVGGSNLASRWCLIPGGGKTVVGPFCFGDSTAGCSQLAAQDSCSHLSGTLFGNLLCLVNGVHSVLGPLCFGSSYNDCALGSLYGPCLNIGGVLLGEADQTNTINSGAWCLIKNEANRVFIGPECQDPANCTSVQSFCNARSGITVANPWCMLPQNYTRVVGPTRWNDMDLGGPKDLCGDTSFCAISSDLDSAERCALVPTATPSQAPTATPSMAPTCEAINCTMAPTESPSAPPSAAPTPTVYPVCNICGNNGSITNPDGQITDTNGTLLGNCQDFVVKGENGEIPDYLCVNLPSQIGSLCGCEYAATGTSAASIAGTTGWVIVAATIAVFRMLK